MRYLIPIVLMLTSCSPALRVYHDFDKDIEIHRLNAYGWLESRTIESKNNPLYINELTDKRIKNAVGKQMKEKGYQYSSELPQIIVHYHLVVENKTTIRPEPFGYRYGRYWIQNEVDTYRYNEGTLILDFMDSRNCDLIWRGWAVSILDDQNLITEELIDRAVEKIFQSFPINAELEKTKP